MPRKSKKSLRKPSKKQDYIDARRELAEAFKENHILKPQAVAVFLEVEHLVYDSKNQIPLSTLTDILITTRAILRGREPDDQDGEVYQEHILDLQSQISRVRRFSFTKLLVANVFALLGVSIIVASGILGAVSFGLCAPLSILGIVFGFSLIGGYVALGTGLLGASFLMFSAPLAANAMQQSSLNQALHQLESNAKRIYLY